MYAYILVSKIVYCSLFLHVSVIFLQFRSFTEQISSIKINVAHQIRKTSDTPDVRELSTAQSMHTAQSMQL